MNWYRVLGVNLELSKRIMCGSVRLRQRAFTYWLSVVQRHKMLSSIRWPEKRWRLLLDTHGEN